jgi:hypothetical protein
MVDDKKLEDWIAQMEIRQKMTNYCRGIDRLDREMIGSAWHPDATCEYEGVIRGPAMEVLDWFMDGHRPYKAHSHQVTNQTIKVDGDKATSEAYVTARLRCPPDESGRELDLVVTGRYLDRWSNRDGNWALDYRYQITDFFSAYEALDTKNLPYCPKHDDTLSKRSHEDPSYANFEGKDHPLVGSIRPVLTTDDLTEQQEDGSRKATVPA